MIKRRIQVRVKPGCSQKKIETVEDGSLLVYVNAPAHEGKANSAVVKLLSEYFDIPKSQVIIVRGEHARNKVIDILDK